MINLLSTTAKKRLWNEYRSRLAVILLTAIAILEMLTVAIFFPSFYALHSTTLELSKNLEERKRVTPEANKAVSDEVRSLKNDLALLRQGTTTTDILPSALLEDIIKVKPAGIALSSVTYQRAPGVVTIQFAGIAGTRDDILVFKTALDKNLLFKVSRSNDYLIKKTNISFSITLTMK